jgi:NADH dehydrogenase [ubiquinone] 1 alpha subcomplex assembly factor 1
MHTVLFEFADPLAVQAWAAIDDRVMGGASRSRLRADTNGHAVFEGEVSLDRNGGFASVRSAPSERGQAGAQACLIDVRGAARQYKLSLLLDDGFDIPSYQAAFEPAGDDWQTLRLPMSSFRASFRGRDVHGAPPVDPARIRQVGLTIAARQAGPFALAVRRIVLV